MAKPLRALLVEDSEADASLLKNALIRGGYELSCRRVQTAEGLRGALRDSDWDVVFCDYFMPGFDAPAAFRIFKLANRGIPFIIVSGEIGEDLAVESLKFGADDYLFKENLRRLIPALERALQDTENRRQRDRVRLMHELIMANSPDLMGTVDEHFRIIEISAASMRILGYEPRELVGRRLTELTHPEDLERTLQEASAIVAGQTSVDFENRCFRKDGSIAHLTWSACWSPVVQFFFCTARDITARKRAEEALEQSESLFHLMVAQIVDYAIYMLDPEGRVVTWNSGAERIKGYLAEEIIGRSFSRFYPPEDLKAGKPAALLEKAGQVGRVLDEGWRVRKGGERFWAQVVLTARRDTLGQPCGFTKITHDITKQKQAEQQRQQMEAELRQSQKMVAVGQLAAGIAHEINTPTQFIGHNLRFLQESLATLRAVFERFQTLQITTQNGAAPPPELLRELNAAILSGDFASLLAELPEAIDDALEGNARVARIVQSMKEFSHPGGGGDSFPVPCDLNPAIESTITVARSEWRYVADVTTDLDPALPQVPVLLTEFNQVILNLLVNAAHAIAEVAVNREGGKGIINVTTRQVGTWVEVRITDSGGGIPEEIRARIFEPFFTTKEVGKGTGQGLALAHSTIVDKHHGELSFETMIGKGTCFIIRLPLNPPAPVKKSQPAPKEKIFHEETHPVR